MPDESTASPFKVFGRPPGAASSQRLSLGIVGTGYVTSLSHLPASTLVDDLGVEALVDVDLSRAKALADQYAVPFVSSDYRDLFGRVDAAIVAVPHVLHAPVSIDLLQRGVHVLCEKPMALSSVESEAMLHAASSSGATLAIGHVRRHYDNWRFAKQLLDSRFLGQPIGFELEESVDFERFPAGAFTVEGASGGVLWDTGPHALDLVLWLFGEVETVAYRDDAQGGVEANCELLLEMATGIRGSVALSRTRRLLNRLRVRCQAGILEVPTVGAPQVLVDGRVQGGAIEAVVSAPCTSVPSLTSCFARQLQDFASAIRSGCEPTVSGTTGARNVALIERCRRVRQPLPAQPWSELRETVTRRNGGNHELHGATALVSGATGFIGGRLVEYLAVGCGARVRAMRRSPGRAVHLARLPVEVVEADLMAPDSLRRAVAGADVVFHCGFGAVGEDFERRQVTVEGTRNLAQAALETGVRRFVHVSTVAVHGPNPGPVVDEHSPYRYCDDVYTNAKIDAEYVLTEYARQGLPVVVLRPTVVYGPRSPAWTVGPVEQMRAGTFTLIEDGSGTANPVYVDDVVQALLLAATREQAVGNAFIISSAETMCWREFYGWYARLLDLADLPNVTWSNVRRTRSQQKVLRNPIVSGFSYLGSPHARGVLGQLPVVGSTLRRAARLPPDSVRTSIVARAEAFREARLRPAVLPRGWTLDYFSATCGADIRKARQVLGYEPSVSIASGMRLTADWLRHTRMV